MRRRIGVLGLLAGLLFAGVAYAEEEAPSEGDRPTAAESEPPTPAFGRSGFYLVAGGATGFDLGAADTLNREISFPAPISFDTAVGFNARAGGRANRWIATEVQFEYLPSFTAQINGVDFAEQRFMTVTLNFMLYLTEGRWQPYALVGAGAAFVDATSPTDSASFSGYALRAAGGLDVYLSPHLALSTEVSFVEPGGGLDGFDYLSLNWSLKYRF